MKILHSYCLNYNIGDYALGIGVKNLLRSHLDVDLIGNTNIQGRIFNEYYINEVVNKRYDLLVIGGGGIIHGSHWPNGWFWLIDKDLIKTIKIPFIVYGVGYNYWDEEGGIPDRGRLHLEETMKYASHFSVRNDGSADRVKSQLGIECDVVPDPGFHINLNTTYERTIDEPYVLIQLANDKPESRFGSLENRASFIQKMREITSELAKKYKVIFAPHVYDDISISKEISKNIPNTSIWDFGYYAFDHSDKAIALYQYAEFAISMRGHGQIVPIAFNTPVISLENHPKHRGLMEELDLLDYNVSISDPDFETTLQKKIMLVEKEKDFLLGKYQKININNLDNSNKYWGKIKNSII